MLHLVRLAIPFILGLVPLALMLVGLGEAAGGKSHETILPGANSPEEIYLGNDGHVWISDYDVGRVWQVNPATGVFTRFEGLASVLDARPGPGGYAWWIDNTHNWLGRLEVATHQVTTWTLDAPSIWGLAFDEQGRVWVGAYNDFQLFRFDPLSHQLCSFALANKSGGYMVDYAGAIWYGRDSEGLGRFDTTSNQNTFWSFGGNAGFGAWSVGANDAAGVWIVDDSRGLVGRLDPIQNTLTTYTSTLLTQDSMVLPRGSHVWFTEAADYVVDIDPAAAVGVTQPATATTSSASFACAPAGNGLTHTITTTSGALVFGSGTLTTTLENGMTHYALPAGSFPYGLADVYGDLWFVDLNRATVTILEAAHKLYLPHLAR